MSTRSPVFFCALVCLVLTATATVWNVPDDVPTIQAALDTLAEGDTVLVAPAVYHESMLAPVHSFALIGVPDYNSDPVKPLVDPSPLPGSPHLVCLNLPVGCRANVIDIDFRNGPEMYPRESAGDVGGIRCNADSLTLVSCRLDSTFKGLYCDAPGFVEVRDCEFVNSVSLAVRAHQASQIILRNSLFSGLSGIGMLARLNDNARVDSCIFTASGGSEWLWLYGNGIEFRNCYFGESADTVHAAIWTYSVGGMTFENNVMEGLRTAWVGAPVLFNGTGGDSTRFVGNTFRRNYATDSGSGGGMVIQGPSVVLSENRFDSCAAWSTLGFGSIKLIGANTMLRNNVFVGPGINLPAVQVQSSPGATIHDCSFAGTHWAINSDGAFDAEMNWWGDSTGPYHSELNPEGLGDWVTGPVDFIPWLTQDPFDTTTGVSDDDFIPRPSSFILSAYPNPFNATATLSLSVETPGMYTIELYNTLGQRVKELWAGNVIGERRLHVKAEELSSGIYFACARQITTGHVVAITKMAMSK